MKKAFRFLAVFAILIPLFQSVYAQEQNKYMLGILNYNAYCTNDLEPYIEFQFIIDGRTTQYVKTEKGTYLSEVEIRVDITQKNDQGVEEKVDGLHYILVSPQTWDSIQTGPTFFSDIQNVKVPNGEYFLYFYLKDLHGETDTVKYIDFLKVFYPEKKIATSNISMWQTFNGSGEGGTFEKYGFAVTPLFQQYAPQSIYAIPFTMEIYNADQIFGTGKEYTVMTAIYEAGYKPEKEYTAYKTMTAEPLSIFFHQFNIFRLPSGNYNLDVYVLDADSNVLASTSAFFQRSNPSIQLDINRYDDVIIEHTFVEKMTDWKALQEDVASLYPIGSRMEQEFFNQRMKKVPLDQLQRYFYSFWLKRNPADPEGAWLEYQKKLEYVQKKYGSSVIKGFRTDRGRVWLRYGPPTNITEEPYDPQSYPYEIWHYYEIGDQTNIKFIFYNRDLATNNYELLHSDYIGERQDPAWQMKLVKRLSPNSNPDITLPEDYWGGNAYDYYRYNK